MGVSIVADDNRAAFVDNTSGIAFGPSVAVARMGERSHRNLANEVLDRAEPSLRKLWDRNPDVVRKHINDAKLDLFPELYDEDDF